MAARRPTSPWGATRATSPGRRSSNGWPSTSTPGPEHARLAKLAGTWDVSVRMREDKNEWVTGSGTSTFEPILGGRYLLEKLHMSVAGRKIEAMVIHGFDLLQRRWFSVWLDESSTWPTYMSGTEDENGVITRTGRVFDVVTPQGRPFTVTMQKEGDRLVSHVYDTIDNAPVEVMQVYRTPRKDG